MNKVELSYSTNFDGYRPVSVILLESSFKRSRQVVPDPQSAQSLSFHVKDELSEEGNRLYVELSVELVYPDKENPNVDIEIKAVGIFIRPSDATSQTDENFTNTHALSIIYPTIKEHLTDLITKSLIPFPSPPFIKFG